MVSIDSRRNPVSAFLKGTMFRGSTGSNVPPWANSVVT